MPKLTYNCCLYCTNQGGGGSEFSHCASPSCTLHLHVATPLFVLNVPFVHLFIVVSIVVAYGICMLNGRDGGCTYYESLVKTFLAGETPLSLHF